MIAIDNMNMMMEMCGKMDMMDMGMSTDMMMTMLQECDEMITNIMTMMRNMKQASIHSHHGVNVCWLVV